MLVKFKRPFFSADAVHYEANVVVEVPDDTKLPQGAVIVDKKQSLPDKGLKPVAGYGALPQNEEDLAQFGANPTKQIVLATGAPREVDTDDEATTGTVLKDVDVKVTPKAGSAKLSTKEL